MTERFSNQAVTLLAGSLSGGATSLTVVSADHFPDAGNFRVVIGNEIMLVTAVSGETFTVSRAQEETNAISHAKGAEVRHVLTVGSLEEAIRQQLGLLDGILYKGVKDCSGNPKFPAADAGDLYMVSVAGKIGGSSGYKVAVGDLLLCNTDGTAEGTKGEVGSKWDIVTAQANVEAAFDAKFDGDVLKESSVPDSVASKSTIDDLFDPEPKDEEPGSTIYGHGKRTRPMVDRDIWSAKDFAGIKGNGDDNTVELIEAIHEARAASKPLFLPAGVYGTTDQLVRPNTEDPLGLIGYAIRGAGKGITKIESSVAGKQLFGATGQTSQGSSVEARTLLADAAYGQRVLSIDTTAEGGLQKDDRIQLRDPSQVFNGNAENVPVGIAGENARIFSVDSPTQVTLYARLNFSYSAAGGATWRKPSFVPSAQVSHMTLDQLVFSSAGRAFSYSAILKLLIDNIEFLNFEDDLVALSSALDWHVTNCDFGFLVNAFNPYGVAAAGYCEDGVVEGNTQRYGRHLFTTTASTTDPGAAHINVRNNVAFESYLAMVDTHANAHHIAFINNYAHGGTTSGMGAQIRGRYCSLINFFGDNLSLGVNVPFGATGTYIAGGRLTGCSRNISINSSNDVKIRNVQVDFPGEHVLEVAQDSDFAQMTGLDIDGLEALTGNPSGAAFNFETWSDTFRLKNMRCPGATTEFSGRKPGVVTEVKQSIERGGQLSAAGAGAYVIAPATIVTSASNTAGLAIFDFDPVHDFGFHLGSTVCDLEITALVNGKEPKQTFKVGMYPVTAVGGSASQVSPTVSGTVTPGSEVTFTSPAAKLNETKRSGNFTAPAAGRYVFQFTTTEAMAAESSIVLRAKLIVKQA